MISAQNIIKTYGNKTKKTQILNNISLTIADRSFTVILGASGSGNLPFSIYSPVWNGRTAAASAMQIPTSLFFPTAN